MNTIYCTTNDSTSIKLTEELEKIYAREYINGFSVAIVNQDGILYEKGFGYSDIKTNKKYTNNTLQNIASISKTFIGITLLKLKSLENLT
ncbi:class A beta-lactamase-related serine hydrolase [Maribacter algicola]|uniref:Class A beta-lactamase-related serine hydrolase n=1 Tax=Maribacter algicola TaxID=2498892 RepID=A0A3R8R6H4_9FLAO|nr:class A beta-lactamase-related serine hydrolase [Maribacter algicola]